MRPGKLVIPGGIDPRDKYGTAVWRDASIGRFFYRDAGGGVSECSKMKFITNNILENESILVELKKAWIDSEPDISGGHEEGGFIVADDVGILAVVRWEKGLQNEIALPPHKNCVVDGRDIIVSFHTHPNTGKDFQQEPSLTDIRAVSDDFDLKGEFYLGEFVISEQNIYMIEPAGDYHVIGPTKALFERYEYGSSFNK